MSGGDAEAAAEFDLFYIRFGRSILSQMIMLTGDLREAEDVVQEAFERAWRRWSEVRDCVSPEAWVRTVARRLAVSRWRRLRNSSTAWLLAGGTAAAPQVVDDRLAVVAALRFLSRQQRIAIVLHHLADLSVQEVADETGSSVAAVKKQLERGRAALADLLTDGEAAPDAASPGLASKRGQS